MSLPIAHVPDIDPSPRVDAATLAFLRFHWARSRCLARCDVFTCCAATLCDKACSAEVRAATLLRALDSDEALGRLRFYEPGAKDVSFDEKWLLAALDAAARGDSDSLTFLLHRRLSKPARRQIGALLMALSRTLSQDPSQAQTKLQTKILPRAHFRVS